MWSKSIEILNPYEACREAPKNERPGRTWFARLFTGLRSVRRHKTG